MPRKPTTPLAKHLAALAGARNVPEATREDAVRRIAAQARKVERARQALARERERLDEAVAYATSAEPASPTWYDKPAVLERPDAARAAGISQRDLEALMRRFREKR